MDRRTERAKAYLAMARDAALDLTAAALKGWRNPVNPKDPLKGGQAEGVRRVHPVFPLGERGRTVLTPKAKGRTTLEEHDRRFHGGHYDGKGTCEYRKGMEKGDGGDAIGGGPGEVTWEGNLGDVGDRELGRVVDAFVARHRDAVYGALGHDGDGTYTRSQGNVYSSDPADVSVWEYDPRNVFGDDDIAEEVVDALPERAEDLDADAVVTEVAKRLNRRLDGMPTSELGPGTCIG